MTKIAITPNASGTGTFTITAPNSDTNRTLTLPDAAGEVLTDASNIPAGNLTGVLPALDGSALINLPSATQAEAEAGTDNTKVMTPLRANQHLLANIRSVNAGLNVGEIGTYAMLIQTSRTNRAAGTVIAGSELRYFATEARTGAFVNHRHYAGDTAATGSWKMMGQVFHLYGDADARAATLFLRIS